MEVSFLNKKFGYNIGVSTGGLRMAGQENQNADRFDTAIAIYKYAIEKNPNDAFAYVTLGRAYEAADQLHLAKNAFLEILGIYFNTYQILKKEGDMRQIRGRTLSLP